MTAQTDVFDAQQHEMSRREFLNYAWLASLGILTAQTTVLTYQFTLPRLQPGEFGGVVPIGLAKVLPGPGEQPLGFARAKFWWIVDDIGARAIFKVCTHLGCIYDWKPNENRFICPCHGSTFERDGVFVKGPAPRNLDQFVIRTYDSGGNIIEETPEDGSPIPIDDAPGTSVEIDTGARIPGAPKNQ